MAGRSLAGVGSWQLRMEWFGRTARIDGWRLDRRQPLRTVVAEAVH